MGNKFSVLHQTVYYGMYLVMALLSLAYFPLAKKEVTIIVSLFLIVGLFQIANKAAIIILFLLVVLYIFQRTKGIFRHVITLTSVLIFAFMLVAFVPRWKDTLKELKENGLTIIPESRTSDQMRLAAWDASLALLRDHFIWGVSWGDAQHELNRMYSLKGYAQAAKRVLNSHNTYFSVLLETGLTGLFFLLAYFYNVWNQMNRSVHYRYFFISFMLLLAVNFIFESMFSRYSGLAFIHFFYSLMLCIPPDLEVQVNIP